MMKKSRIKGVLSCVATMVLMVGLFSESALAVTSNDNVVSAMSESSENDLIMPLASSRTYTVYSGSNFTTVGTGNMSPSVSMYISSWDSFNYKAEIYAYGRKGLIWYDQDLKFQNNRVTFDCGRDVTSLSFRILPQWFGSEGKKFTVVVNTGGI